MQRESRIRFCVINTLTPRKNDVRGNASAINKEPLDIKNDEISPTIFRLRRSNYRFTTENEVTSIIDSQRKNEVTSQL